MISNEKVRELVKPLSKATYFLKNRFVFSVVSKKVMKGSDEVGVQKGCSN